MLTSTSPFFGRCVTGCDPGMNQVDQFLILIAAAVLIQLLDSQRLPENDPHPCRFQEPAT